MPRFEKAHRSAGLPRIIPPTAAEREHQSATSTFRVLPSRWWSRTRSIITGEVPRINWNVVPTQ